MLKRLPYSSILLFLLVITVSCAGMSENTSSGRYIGTVKGRYASIHYKADEDGRIFIALENTTTVAMSNLIVNVSQKTSAGSSDMQGSTRLLKIRNIYQIPVPLAPNATGNIKVSYYFLPRAEGGIGLSPHQSGDFAANIPGSEYGYVMDDTVEFRIPLP